MKLVELTQDKVAVVSDDKYELVSKYKWYAQFDPKGDRWYAKSHLGNNKYISMHRLILGLSADDTRFVDHKDRDGLNNLNENLRLATHSQNIANSKQRAGGSSKYKGVSWHSRPYGGWRARLTVNYQTIDLGYFDTEKEAARAYDAAAREHFGEFANLNFPE